MKKTVALAVVGLVGVAALSACGGGDDTKPKKAVPPQQVLSTEQLTSAVLDIADLPGGFVPVAFNPVYSGTPSYFCDYTPTAAFKIRVERDFVSTADASQDVNVSIRQYADAKAAKAAFADLKKAMETCKSETDGATITYTTSPVTGVGDDALRISASYEGGGYTQMFAVKGPSILTSYGSGSKTSIPDDSTLQGLLVKQVEHYLTIAANPPKEGADQDGDRTPDITDAFPFNKSEAADANQNGIGDKADAQLKRKVANAKFTSQRDLAQIMKNPAAHTGKVIKLWGNITQFDSATGTESFLANAAATDTTSYGYFDGDSAYFTGNEKLLKKVVQDDTFTATVRVIGSYTYDTAMGGTNTVAYFEVRAIQVP